MLGNITVGMEVQVKPEEPVSGTYKAKVTVVDHVVDAGVGTLGIRMELPDPDLKIPAGLKCTVRFPQKQENGRGLPLKPPRTRIDSPYETPRIAMEMDMGAMFGMGGHRRRELPGLRRFPLLVKPKAIAGGGKPHPGIVDATLRLIRGIR